MKNGEGTNFALGVVVMLITNIISPLLVPLYGILRLAQYEDLIKLHNEESHDRRTHERNREHFARLEEQQQQHLEPEDALPDPDEQYAEFFGVSVQPTAALQAVNLSKEESDRNYTRSMPYEEIDPKTWREVIREVTQPLIPQFFMWLLAIESLYFVLTDIIKLQYNAVGWIAFVLVVFTLSIDILGQLLSRLLQITLWIVLPVLWVNATLHRIERKFDHLRDNDKVVRAISRRLARVLRLPPPELLLYGVPWEPDDTTDRDLIPASWKKTIKWLVSRQEVWYYDGKEKLKEIWKPLFWSLRTAYFAGYVAMGLFSIYTVLAWLESSAAALHWWQ